MRASKWFGVRSIFFRSFSQDQRPPPGRPLRCFFGTLLWYCPLHNYNNTIFNINLVPFFLNWIRVFFVCKSRLGSPMGEKKRKKKKEKCQVDVHFHFSKWVSTLFSFFFFDFDHSVTVKGTTVQVKFDSHLWWRKHLHFYDWKKNLLDYWQRNWAISKMLTFYNFQCPFKLLFSSERLKPSKQFINRISIRSCWTQWSNF